VRRTGETATGAGGEPRRSDPGSLAPALAVTGLLAARNVAEPFMPAWTYTPLNTVLGLSLVAAGRRTGSSWRDLGLDREDWHASVRDGAATAAVAAGAMAAAAAAPGTRSMFDDERVEVPRGRRELLYQTVLRIPLGTVAFEEVAFRGVLLSLLRRRWSTATAVAIDSVLFGLWHIVPSLRAGRCNGVEGRRLAGLVAGSVAGTAAGGAAFCLLRIRADHVLAPALVHLAINDSGYALSWRTRVSP
jgi:uncharacterized protein